MRNMRMLAMNTSSFLTGRLTPDQLEGVLNVNDILQLDAECLTAEKKTVLSRLVGLFSPQFPPTDSRRLIWRAVLEHQEQFTAGQKSEIAAWIRARFEANEEGEAE